MATGFLTPDARLRILSALNVVVPGAKLHTYVGGTPATPLTTYNNADLAAGHENANPIVADAGGLFGPIFLLSGTSYKLVLTDASDVEIWSQDGVATANSLVGGTGISVTTVGGVTTIASTGPAVASIGTNDFRLTLESGVPVSSTDQTAKGTLYCTPMGRGNRMDVYSAAGVPTTLISAQISIAVPAVASQVYSVWAYNNAGVLTLELAAWTNDTTPGTAAYSISATTGTWTKTGDLTRRFLGLMRTTTVVSQTEDSLVKRFVWNVNNRVRRPLQRYESATGWAYNGVVRQANGSPANQVDVVVGVAEVSITLFLQAAAQASVAGTFLSVGIGEDSTTTYTVGGVTNQSVGGTGFNNASCSLTKVPAIGRHFYSWNECSSAATTNWVAASASGGSNITAGLTGSIEG